MLTICFAINEIRSSRKIARQSKINKEVIWLLNGLQPKYRVIADFRKDNTEALTNVFKSFVRASVLILAYTGKSL